MLKTAAWGYDGKGQARLAGAHELPAAWRRMGSPRAVLEAFVAFRSELSVVGVRGTDGAIALYDPFANQHADHVLDVTVWPAPVAPATRAAALEIARAVLEGLDVVGVLTVELFELDDGRLLVNELAPRPHNSGHLTIDAHGCGQFEQQVRAVCGLPLGSVRAVAPAAAMANLMGDLWASGTPDWTALLADRDVRLHLYGKEEARPGRKMGHLSRRWAARSRRSRRGCAARAALTRGRRSAVSLDLVLANLLTPPILFFALGMVATLMRSDLEIPAAVTKALALYLLFAIGMRGGAELAAAQLSPATFVPLGVGVAASALFPLGAFALLRRRLGAADAAAVAATYGSISAVTFATACSFLDDRGTAWSGTMVAAMALMESPAILVAVLLARRHGVVVGAAHAAGRPAAAGARPRSLFAESFSSGPVVLLLGSFAVGILGGPKGWASVEPFAHAPFKGVLCLFLLDLGLVAARRLDDLRRSGGALLGFAVVAPLVHAALGIAAAWATGLPPATRSC